MEEKNIRSVPIDRQLVPDYYPEFHCSAQACLDSCCVGWGITFGKRDLLTMRELCADAGLGETFEHGVRRIRRGPEGEPFYAAFLLDEEGRCPFLAESGLCEMQLHCGHKALPGVCQSFPRHKRHTPAGHLERSCSIGCGEVLRLLLERKDGLGFIEDPLPKQEQVGRDFTVWGPFARDFSEIRDLCIDVLQDRSHPLPQRLLMLGYMMRDLSAPEHAEGLADPAAWIRQKRLAMVSPELWEMLAQFPGSRKFFLLNNFRYLQTTSLDARAQPLLNEISTLLEANAQLNLDTMTTEVHLSMVRYEQAEQDFLSAYGNLEYFFENVMVNTFFYGGYPIADPSRTLWENCFLLCSFYSHIRFLTTCCCHGGEEQLIHVVTMAARSFLHNSGMQGKITTEFQKYDNRSLQDLAILVCG